MSDTVPTPKPTLPDEGSLAVVSPVELVERLMALGLTGRVHLVLGAVEGELGFMEGGLVDARILGDFGEGALFRMLGAGVGSYRLERRVSTTAPPQSFREWSALRADFESHLEQLARYADKVGGFERVWALRFDVLRRHLAELPDQVNPLLRRLDGRRTVGQVVTETPLAEKITLRVLAKLLRLGVLMLPDELPADAQSSPLSGRLTDEARVPVIGSDLPVQPAWFEEGPAALAERQARDRRAVLEGELSDTPLERPEEADDTVLPASGLDRASGPAVAESAEVTTPPAAGIGSLVTEEDEPVVPSSEGPAEAPVAEPEAAEASEPEPSEPEASEPEASEPEASEPEVAAPAPDAALHSDEGAALDPARPLPEPELVTEPPRGVLEDAVVSTWSSQGAPPPLALDDEEGQRELDEWLGEEEEFFNAPVPEHDHVRHVQDAVTVPAPVPGIVKLGFALALLAISIALGFGLGRGCSPEVEPPPVVGSGNLSSPDLASTVEG
jgi:hypothetical protein